MEERKNALGIFQGALLTKSTHITHTDPPYPCQEQGGKGKNRPNKPSLLLKGKQSMQNSLVSMGNLC